MRVGDEHGVMHEEEGLLEMKHEITDLKEKVEGLLKYLKKMVKIGLFIMPPRQQLAARKEAARHRRSAFDRFDCHSPPTYDGAADPVALENWLREMEKLFTATNCPDAEMVPIGTYYLKREADNWWGTVKAACMATAGFGGSMDIQKYTDRFTELSKFAGVIPTEAERVKRYIKKMNPRVRTLVLCSGVTTFQAAYEMALSVHASVKEEEAVKVASARKSLRLHLRGSRFRLLLLVRLRSRSLNQVPEVGIKVPVLSRVLIRPSVGGVRSLEAGHKSYECLKNPRATAKPPVPPSLSAPPKNRVYSMTHSDADVHPDVISGTFPVNSVPASVLFDSGASVSCVSNSFAKKANLFLSSPP
ncbi:uncharacterized protein LOC130590153 [Beta vulgaris subsp. vulgaris]|uniref:uncharacterized protein LOC130590153 n=1 Tax=Beta vulgaris subsp. vulgaris TaxID=3555 RepID=UPI002548F05F|nr:uncharacterized protein LOC130590153 [Beta vulgaris subsp. vulgaris]